MDTLERVPKGRIHCIDLLFPWKHNTTEAMECVLIGSWQRQCVQRYRGGYDHQ